MLRAIVAVLAGYAVIVLVVALTFSAAYTMMGVDGAFEPGTYAVSTPWLVASIGLSILGAVAGGAVASAILPCRRRSSPRSCSSSVSGWRC
jgi:hypothetical protein